MGAIPFPPPTFCSKPFVLSFFSLSKYVYYLEENREETDQLPGADGALLTDDTQKAELLSS